MTSASRPSGHSALPLDGVRVLDLTHYTAGPFCTRLLADYGADVVKIERPGTGDPARMLPPFHKDQPGLERSGLFLFLNTNKRSVTLDLKTPEGAETVKRLAEKADVLVENFRPGVMPSLGLGYETLRAINPRLVMTSISNFGQTGPYRDWRATDLTIYAMGGAMINTGHPQREPLTLGGHIPTFQVGAAAAAATGIALHGAETMGQGDHLDIAAFEVWMGAIDRRMSYLMSHQYAGDTSTRDWPASALGSGIWQCKDGHFFTTSGPARFESIARMVGAAHLLEHPDWSSLAARSNPDRIDEFAAIVIPWMLERTKREIRALCQEHGVLGGPINSFADLLDDEHFQYRQWFQEIEHPTTGKLTYPGYGFKLHRDGEPMPPRRRAPLLGEHTEEVLREWLGEGGDGRGAHPSGSRTVGTAPLPAVLGGAAPTVGGSKGASSLGGSPPSPQRRPLEGLRILDLTVVWAGPYTTQMLAEWGAEVIRVESIQHFPSTTRGMVVRPTKQMASIRGSMSAFPDRDPGERPWNRSASFNAHARNKRSMTVDLTRPEGQEVFDNLLRISDGVVENNVPVSMERVGVTWERIRKVNPNIVFLRMPAFGVDGPYKNYRTFGSHMAANVGHYSVMGYPGEDASQTGNTLAADAIGGMAGTLAFAAGLRYRREQGTGIFIETATAESLATYFGDFILDYTMNGRLHGHQGNRHWVFAPQGVYSCEGDDRWLSVSVTSDEEWRALCRAMERPDLVEDARYATVEGRRAAHDELDAEILTWTVGQDAIAAMNALQEAGVPAGVVMQEPVAFADPHLKERGFWVPLTHPEAGTHLHTRALWLAERTPTSHWRAAPRLGEDNEYVYKELLGFTDAEYRRFEETGHIGMDYAPHVRG